MYMEDGETLRAHNFDNGLCIRMYPTCGLIWVKDRPLLFLLTSGLDPPSELQIALLLLPSRLCLFFVSFLVACQQC